MSPCKLLAVLSGLAFVVSILALTIDSTETIYIICGSTLLGTFLCTFCDLCFDAFMKVLYRQTNITVKYVVHVEQPDSSDYIGVVEKNVFIV